MGVETIFYATFDSNFPQHHWRQIRNTRYFEQTVSVVFIIYNKIKNLNRSLHTNTKYGEEWGGIPQNKILCGN